MRIRFRLEAAGDVESARDWYEQQSAGLGQKFLASFDHAIDLIARFPRAFPEIAGEHRRALLHRLYRTRFPRQAGGLIIKPPRG
jgi:plasmid stabilization system protein ParE